MRNGFRWWWSFSRKPCIGLSWKLPHLFFMMLCIPCPNFMRIQFVLCEICSIQIRHFMWGTICMKNMNVNGKPASIVAPPPNWIIFHVLMESRSFYLSCKVSISPKINMLSFFDALEDINQYMQHSMILKFSQTFSSLTTDLFLKSAHWKYAMTIIAQRSTKHGIINLVHGFQKCLQFAGLNVSGLLHVVVV